MDRETMDPSEGEKTTDREIQEPSEGERTKIMDPMAKAKEFLQGYYRRLEAEWADVANLYREDSVMTFDGENIQGKEAIRAKLTSLQPRFYEVLNIKCLPVSGTGFDSGTGFSSGLHGGLHGVVGGTIWLDGKQDARPFSQMFVLLPTPEGSFDISHSILFTGPES